jgi:hypothetical protein
MEVVERMYPRSEVFATRVQASAVYFAFVAGCLKAATGTSLADFPEVENYPNTEPSQAVASSIRATLNFLYGDARERFPTQWPANFWNRALELEECQGLSRYMAQEQGQENG